jgi:BirA family biotin operon repressor/biotin-[acetyl-CoA-carboxylase] ligase
MREKIIKFLRDNTGTPVSGEEISKQLHISRTAVWKHVQQLKQAGYDIKAAYKKGYTLYAPPDLLLPAEITARLTTKWLGRRIIYQNSLQSTNDLAKQIALDNCPHGAVVVAEEQTGGRGRIARGWFSPLGKGIWFSIVLRPPLPPEEASKFTLLMAVALSQTFAVYPGLPIGVKWPNDIMYEDKKLVGILTEMNAEMEAINYLVVGTGINVSVPRGIFPDDIKDKAASLNDFSPVPVQRVRLFADILKTFEDMYDKVLREGFAPALDEWRKYSVTLGRRVKVAAPGEVFCGQALDIDESGALLVERENGRTERVLAGDVSIRETKEDV